MGCVLLLEGNHRWLWVLRPVDIQLQEIDCVRVVGHAILGVCPVVHAEKGGWKFEVLVTVIIL